MEQRQPLDELLLEDETEPAFEQPGAADIEPVPLIDDLAAPSPPPALAPGPARLASMVRGAARMLFAFAFSQYVIVTVLVAGVAVMLSKTASDLLIAKFDAIAQAIRHF
jgi:hypothetical protein